MAERNLELDVFRDLLEQSELVGQLAKEEKAFTAVYEAFRAQDPKAYFDALERLKLTPFCRFVCDWIRIKECVFRCIELCGPPKPITDFDPRLLAEGIVRITADPAVLKRLVEAVEKPDRDAFHRIVTEYKLDAFCHLFCHWVCVVRYRLICHWLCTPDRPRRPDFIGELQAAGRALRLLLAKREVFDAAVAASNAGDAAKLGAILRGPELFRLCYLICEWFCSLRCVLACLTLCRQFFFDGSQQNVALVH